MITCPLCNKLVVQKEGTSIAKGEAILYNPLQDDDPDDFKCPTTEDLTRISGYLEDWGNASHFQRTFSLGFHRYYFIIPPFKLYYHADRLRTDKFNEQGEPVWFATHDVISWEEVIQWCRRLRLLKVFT